MNMFKIKKRNSTNIKLFLILLILYRPEYVLQNTYLDLIVNILRVIITICLIIKVIIVKKRNKLVLPLVIWGAFNLYCLFNGTWEFSVLIELAIILDVFSLTILYYPLKSEDLYISLSDLLMIYGVCNTVTIFIGNANENLFLGFDNDVAMRIIPLIGIQLFLSIMLYGKIKPKDFIICAIYLLDYILTLSSSGLLALIIMFFMIYSRKLSYKHIKSKNAILLTAIIWALLYFANIQYLLSFLFSVLKKDMTLSYRTFIWKSVLVAIKRSPIFGYGNLNANDVYYNIVKPQYYASIYPHNLWLYIVASVGIVGLLIFVAFIIHSFKNVDKNYKLQNNKVLMATLMAYLVCGIFASYYAIEYFAFLLAIATFTGNERPQSAS